MYLDTAANWKIAQWPKLGQFEQEKKVLLDHNPKGKINIHGSTLINTQASKQKSKQTGENCQSSHAEEVQRLRSSYTLKEGGRSSLFPQWGLCRVSLCPRVQYGKGKIKGNFAAEKADKHCFSQGFKVNINSPKSC